MIKKLIIVALAALVVFLLVKYIPEMIGKEKKAQTEQFNNMEQHAQKQAQDMLGAGPSRVDRAVGGQYGDRAIRNAEKANTRSMNEVHQMEQEENREEQPIQDQDQ